MVEIDYARYIKLGAGGVWESLCLEDGTLRLGFYEVPHEAPRSGDKEAIRQIYLERGVSKQVASSYAGQVQSFYEELDNTIWITFADGYLWWCRASAEIEVLGYNPEQFPEGSRLRRTIDGWSNRDTNGNELRICELNGRLTSIANYRGTICEVNCLDYLTRRINGLDLPEVARAREAREAAIISVAELLTLLTWRDFELLVELVFAASGWRRTGESGGTQKTVDIELELPSTGERAFVQVKSKTDNHQFEDYIQQFGRRGESRMFYVYHSAKETIRTPESAITVVGPNELAEMILTAGLFDWLIEKAR